MPPSYHAYIFVLMYVIIIAYYCETKDIASCIIHLTLKLA